MDSLGVRTGDLSAIALRPVFSGRAQPVRVTVAPSMSCTPNTPGSGMSA